MRTSDNGDRLRRERAVGRGAGAKYFVLRTKREKRACKKCEEQGVATAPVPERIIEKGLVSDRVVIDTIVAKYSDHNPLYRQSVILLRDAGSTSAAPPCAAG